MLLLVPDPLLIYMVEVEVLGALKWSEILGE